MSQQVVDITKDDLKLQQAALRMRNAHPALWEDLLAAFDEYAIAKAKQLVLSPPEILQRAQGFAWMAQHFAKKFRDAPADVKRDEEMKNALANKR